MQEPSVKVNNEKILYSGTVVLTAGQDKISLSLKDGKVNFIFVFPKSDDVKPAEIKGKTDENTVTVTLEGFRKTLGVGTLQPMEFTTEDGDQKSSYLISLSTRAIGSKSEILEVTITIVEKNDDSKI
jgi:hypothetical protein